MLVTPSVSLLFVAGATLAVLTLRLRKRREWPAKRKGSAGNHRADTLASASVASTPLDTLPPSAETFGARDGKDCSTVHPALRPPPPPPAARPARRLEVLVHNISHKDMVLALGLTPTASLRERAGNGSELKAAGPAASPASSPDRDGSHCRRLFQDGQPSSFSSLSSPSAPTAAAAGTAAATASSFHAPSRRNGASISADASGGDVEGGDRGGSAALARPKFSLFGPVSQTIMARVRELRSRGGGLPVAAFFPAYAREKTLPDYPLRLCNGRLGRRLPVGFDLSGAGVAIPVADLTGFKVRSRDAHKLEGPAASAPGGTMMPGSAPPRPTPLPPAPPRTGAAAASVTGQLSILPDGKEPSAGASGDDPAAAGPPTNGFGLPLGAFRAPIPPAPASPPSKRRSRTGSPPLIPPGPGEAPAGYVTGVFFPLLAVLLPKWKASLREETQAHGEGGGCGGYVGYNGFGEAGRRDTDGGGESDGSFGSKGGGGGGGGGGEDCDKAIYLVSGVGMPRDRAHKVEDNSTEMTAALMEIFLARHHPDVRVVRVHSTTNIFRYDDNIRFVQRQLLPMINRERQRAVEGWGEKWRDMLQVTISFADGSPARISSINAALRHYRPSFMHMWELKTFWHEAKVCEDDIEMHTFEDIGTIPPVPASEIDPLAALAVREMIRLRDDFEAIIRARSNAAAAAFGFGGGGDGGGHGGGGGGGSGHGGGGGGSGHGGSSGGDSANDCGGYGNGGYGNGGGCGGCAACTGDDLSSFWLRKTRKPVLAILVVQRGGGGGGGGGCCGSGAAPPRVYRGTNMEVSMPTGSLCAERNVIGSALADDLRLRRQDLRIVAVMGMSLPRDDGAAAGGGGSSGGGWTPLPSPCMTPVKVKPFLYTS
ncbi:unnamed protein product, partial [Phaeothamnion confervicola]